MSSAASGSRSFEVACVAIRTFGAALRLGTATFALLLMGRGLAAVFVAGVGADRLEGVARRVPDDGPGECAVVEERIAQAWGEVGQQTPGTSPKQPPTRPPITHTCPHPRYRVRAWLLVSGGRKARSLTPPKPSLNSRN